MTRRLEWLRQLKGLAKPNDSIFMRREIAETDEWLAEAYVETDYSELDENEFEKILKIYSIFCYKLFKDDIVPNKEELYWFLDNYEEFETTYKKSFNDKPRRKKLNISEWKTFYVEDLFDIETGKDLIYSSLSGKEYNVIGQGVQNNGVVCTTDELTDYTLYDANTTLSMAHIGNFFATIQESDFYAGTRVKSLISRFDEFGSTYVKYRNKFILAFIATIINLDEFRFSYVRVGSDKIPYLKIKLPCKKNSNGTFLLKKVKYKRYKVAKGENPEIENDLFVPDFKYMEDYIKGLLYSKCLE